MNVYQQPPHQHRYLPVIVPLPGTVKHSSRKLSVATIEVPDHICGVALRVGYTGKLETDLAIYRLKIRTDSNSLVVTLKGFFVLKEGIFQTYER